MPGCSVSRETCCEDRASSPLRVVHAAPLRASSPLGGPDDLVSRAKVPFSVFVWSPSRAPEVGGGRRKPSAPTRWRSRSLPPDPASAAHPYLLRPLRACVTYRYPYSSPRRLVLGVRSLPGRRSCFRHVLPSRSRADLTSSTAMYSVPSSGVAAHPPPERPRRGVATCGPAPVARTRRPRPLGDVSRETGPQGYGRPGLRGHTRVRFRHTRRPRFHCAELQGPA